MPRTSPPCAASPRARDRADRATSDQDVRVVSRHRRRLGARVFLPRHPVIELCQDKYRVERLPPPARGPPGRSRWPAPR